MPLTSLLAGDRLNDSELPLLCKFGVLDGGFSKFGVDRLLVENAGDVERRVRTGGPPVVRCVEDTSARRT